MLDSLSTHTSRRVFRAQPWIFKSSKSQILPPPTATANCHSLMCFFHRKPRKPRPSSSSSTPISSSSAVATKPQPSSANATYSYDRDSEEARMLFANLNICDQMPEPQHRTPSPPLSSFLQVPPIVPSNPDSSSDQDGDENLDLGVYRSYREQSANPVPPTEPQPRATRMDLNVNLYASFFHSFSNQVGITSHQEKTSLTKISSSTMSLFEPRSKRRWKLNNKCCSTQRRQDVTRRN